MSFLLGNRLFRPPFGQHTGCTRNSDLDYAAPILKPTNAPLGPNVKPTPSCLSSSRPLLALLLQRPQPETLPNCPNGRPKMIRTLASEMNHAKKMDQIHAKNTMPLKKKDVGFTWHHRTNLSTNIHAKKSDPQTSMQLKKKNWWFLVYGQI